MKRDKAGLIQWIIGEECSKARVAKDYSLTEFADLVGYTKANVSVFEHGKNNNLYLLMCYVRYCDLDVKEVLLKCQLI